MRSDHIEILTSFKLTVIKFKVNEKIAAHIDWKLIWYHNLTNKLFNNSLPKSIYGSTTYSNYNKNILEASTNTATISNQKNKVWFHFSRDSLLPFIEDRYALLSDYRTLSIGKGDSSDTKTRLQIAQIAVDDNIALTKAAWSANQAEKIHAIRFNPKELWESVCVLSGGDTSHHASPTVMRMRLPNGEIATTDVENAYIFGPHFHRVFNNHRLLDWPVLDNINQREVMEKLDHPISWDEVNKSTTELTNGKVPGLNGVPPNTFKTLDDANLSWLLLFYNQLWHSQADLDK